MLRIDGDTPALRTDVAQALNTLRANHSGWMFEIRFGVNLLLPPLLERIDFILEALGEVKPEEIASVFIG